MSDLATVRTIRLHRQLGLAKRRRRVPRQGSFRPIYLEYGKNIREIALATRQALAPLISELPIIARYAQLDRAIRNDASDTARVKELIRRASEQLSFQISPTSLETLAQKFADKTSSFNKLQLQRQTRAALGVDLFISDPGLKARMETFVAENVALISDVPKSVLTRVETTTFRGISRGLSADQLADELDDQFEFGETRSARIARDQIGSFYGQLNATRQQALGLTRFIWRTSHDQRVRDEHAAREEASDPDLGGTPFTYENPPDGELPGEPYGCRCHAEPYFDDILQQAA